MAKLHGFKKNLNPSRVEIAKFAEDADKKRGKSRFLGRRSERNKITLVPVEEEKKEESRIILPDGLTFEQREYKV